MKAGFSLSDTERLYNDYDVRVFRIVSAEIQKQNEIDRLVRKMDFAEAMNAAYVGSQPDKQHRNSKSFTRWLDSIVRKIGKLQNRKVLTIWDNMKRSKKL